MKYLSLFSGIGGFELGIQQAYESNNEHAHIGEESQEEERSQGRERAADKHGVQLHGRDGTAPLCIGYSEIDKYAIQIYEKHFKHTNYGDITKLNPTDLPDFDLIVGGFPCQAFSIAGKRKGFDDTRGTLFFDIARIIKEKRPRYILLENVKGLLSHDTGRTFKTILSTLTELGYDIQSMVLNAKNFGVPQNRERVFIVGHIRGEPRPEVFPIGSDNTEDNRSVGKGLSNTLTGRSAGGKNWRGNYVQSNKSGLRQIRNLPNNPDSRGGQTHPASIRRLTPFECERLMGFPDGWTEGVSDTQKYKTLGNAVVTNVVQAIVKRLLAPTNN